jgi:hypothetical protein
MVQDRWLGNLVFPASDASHRVLGEALHTLFREKVPQGLAYRNLLDIKKNLSIYIVEKLQYALRMPRRCAEGEIPEKS